MHFFCPTCHSLVRPPNYDPKTGLCPACQPAARPKPKRDPKPKSKKEPHHGPDQVR